MKTIQAFLDRRRERILDAAGRLLRAEGRPLLNDQEYLRCRHFSPGAIYYHFKSKDDIVAAVFDRLVRREIGTPMRLLHGSVESFSERAIS